LVGVHRTPTAAMYEDANTNRPGAVSGLYLRPRTSLQAAFGGPIESARTLHDRRVFVV